MKWGMAFLQAKALEERSEKMTVISGRDPH